MTFKLTTESGVVLTERWHDQTLDLESLELNEATRSCVFVVTEAQREALAKPKFLLRRKPIQHCCVTVKNVTHMQVIDAEGEVELYINEVEACPNRLCMKCMNGTLELHGEGLEVTLDIVRLDTAGETEISLATPIGDVSWRRKERRGKAERERKNEKRVPPIDNDDLG